MDGNREVKRNNELDALRGIACLMVVLFHFTMNRPEANLGFKVGTTGVDLFFMISGFVIFMSLSRVNSSREFIINRICRLYPTYWACVTFTFLLISADLLWNRVYYSPGFVVKYFVNLSMFQFYTPFIDLDGPYWTMIVEMLFYIGMVCLLQFKFLSKLILICTICILVTVSGIVFFHERYLLPFLLHWIPLFQFLPLFFAGILFYKIYHNSSFSIQKYLLVLLCFFSQILLFNYVGRSHGENGQYTYILMLFLFFSAFLLFVNNKLGFIVNKFTLFMGKISFALYLVHQCISLQYLIPLSMSRLHLSFWVSSIFIALPVVILLASFITFRIEIPFGKQMKIILRQKFIRPLPTELNNNN